MSAAGLIALAFVVTRVGVWLNQSMQQRNELFQHTRKDAASIQPGQGPVRFDAPGGIHLIGPGAGTTGGLGQQPNSSYDASCSSAAMAQAAQKRGDLLTALGVTVPILRYSVALLHTEARRLLVEANELVTDATKIVDALQEINDIIDPRLAHIHDMDEVQGRHDHEIDLSHGGDLPKAPFLTADCLTDFGVSSDPQTYQGLHNIDERMSAINCQLSWWTAHSVAWTIAKLERLEEVRRQLDPNNAGSTAWSLEQATKACEGGTVVEGTWPISSCFTDAHPLGIDIAAPTGTVVRPFKAGTVIVADDSCGACDTGYGNYVVIQHEGGTRTLYAHLSAIYVGVGGVVNPDDPDHKIGEVGNSGHVIAIPPGDGSHLHFEVQKLDVDGITWVRQNPFEGAGCTEYETTSDALGSSFGATCDPDEITRLEGLVRGLQGEERTIPGEVAPYTVNDLPALRDVRTDLWGEWSALAPLANEVTLREGRKEVLLNGVEMLLGNPHISRTGGPETWMSLWAQLADQHGLGTVLAPDLSNVYRDRVNDADLQNLGTLGEPSVSGDLEELLWRLWWLVRQRLDYAQSAQSEFPQQVNDQHEEYFDGSDFWIPDAVTGCFHNANGVVVCTAPPDARARYLELVHLIQVLRDQASNVRELLIDAEGLEQVGQAECASKEDQN